MNEMTEVQRGFVPTITYTLEQVELIKRTVARGATDDELALFLYTAKATGLNPLLRQIHAVKRWDSSLEKDVMAIQVGIDGLRLVAERSGRYAPGREPSYESDKDGKLLSATAYVKKLAGGMWHETAATAYYSEYVGKKKDGNPTIMWATKSHIMLAKCAEALALRRAFPNETAGVHADEELDQAENPSRNAPIAPPQAKAPASEAKTLNPVVEYARSQHEAEASVKPEEKHQGDRWELVPTVANAKPDKNGKLRYSVRLPDDTWAATYDKKHGEAILAAKEAKQKIVVYVKIEGSFINIVDVILAE